jgi:hypothetical protein
MDDQLDGAYLTWLYSQVASLRLRSPNRTYWFLLRQLYTTEFVWYVPNDDNRVEDGRDLRFEFVDTHDYDQVDPDWLSLPCSFLELLIAMSRRLSFIAEGEPSDWFWEMIANLELADATDAAYQRNHLEGYVSDILERVMRRKYFPDGKGGLFPLRYPTNDQREVELWGQLNLYLMERKEG